MAQDPWASQLLQATGGPSIFNETEPLTDADVMAIGEARAVYGDPDSFASQVSSAFNQAIASGAKSIEVMGRQFDFQSWEDFGKEIHDSYMSEATKYGIPEIQTMEDVEDFDDFPSFLKALLAQSVPSVMLSMGSGATGAAIGGLMAGPPGAVAGGLLGAFISSAGLNTGELAKEIEERGGTPEQTDAAALGIGAFLGTLDTVGLGKVLQPFMKPVIKEYGVDMVGKELVKLGLKKEAVNGALQGIVAEGATEGLQEATMLYSAAALTGTELDPDELKDRVFTAMAAGSLVGGGIGSFSSSTGALINNSEFKRIADLREKAALGMEKMKRDGLIDAQMSIDEATPSVLQQAILHPEVNTFASARNATLLKGAAPGYGRVLLDYLGGKSITLMDRGAAISDTWDKIRNTFYLREVQPHRDVDVDLHGESQLKLGTWTRKLQFALDQMSSEEIGQLAPALRGEIDPGSNIPFFEKVNIVKDLLADIRQQAIDTGMSVGYIEEYFPRYFNVPALHSDPQLRQQFISTLLQHTNMKADSAERFVDKITRGEGVIITDDLFSSERFSSLTEIEAAIEEGKLHPQRRSGKTEILPKAASLENHRRLKHIPDSVLAPFLINDPQIVLQEYIRQASKRIPYARKFGAKEEKLKGMILRSAKEMEDVGRPMTRTELDRVYDMADAYLGLYKPIAHPMGRRVNDTLTTYNYLNLLPLSLMSTLQEPFIILEAAGGKEFSSAVGQVLKEGTVNKLKRVFKWGKNGKQEFTKSEFRQDIEDFGLVTDQAAMARIAATFGGQPDYEPAIAEFEQNLQKVTNKFFRLNGLGPATQLFKAISYGAGLKLVESRLGRLANEQAPVGSSRWRQWIAELEGVGLPLNEGIEWYKNGADHKAEFYQKYVRQSAFKFTNGIVMHPNAFNRPMWMNNPHFRLLAQLKGFQTVFGNTVLKRWFDKAFTQGMKNNVRSAGKIAGTAIVMSLIALMMNHLREMLTYWDEEGNPRTKNEDPWETAMRAWERTGFLGNMQFAVDASRAHRFGADTLDPILGPTVSKATGLFDGLTTLIQGGDVDKLANEVLKSIPGLSVSPALREAIRENLN